MLKVSFVFFDKHSYSKMMPRLLRSGIKEYNQLKRYLNSFGEGNLQIPTLKNVKKTTHTLFRKFPRNCHMMHQLISLNRIRSPDLQLASRKAVKCDITLSLNILTAKKELI